MNRRTNDTIRRRYEREVPLTPESIDGYLEHLRSAGRVQGTLDSYRRKIGRLYQTLPEDDKSIRRLCPAAQVAEEKGNPRCLRKMYQATRESIERNVALLVERAQDRLLEEEQLTVGWEK